MPHQFWKLTFKEFEDLYDGYVMREETEYRKLAQLAVWITAPHVKKPATVDKLLGKKKERKKTTEQETENILMDLMADMGIKGGAA